MVDAPTALLRGGIQTSVHTIFGKSGHGAPRCSQELVLIRRGSAGRAVVLPVDQPQDCFARGDVTCASAERQCLKGGRGSAGRRFDWQNELKQRAFILAGRRRKLTAMTLNGHPANGQSQSHSSGLRRNEWIEYAA